MNLTDMLFENVRTDVHLTDSLFNMKATGGGGGLPSEYREVGGFSMNDNCYWVIDDFKLTGADTLIFSFSITAACNVIGSYSGSASGNNYSLYATTSSGNYLRYKNGAYNSKVDANEMYNVVIRPTGTDGMKTDSTWTQEDFTCTTDFCIGTTAENTSSAKLKGSLFGHIEVIDGSDEYRLCLVPCERLSDSVLGYYDLVSGVFYEPAYGTPVEL